MNKLLSGLRLITLIVIALCLPGISLAQKELKRKLLAASLLLLLNIIVAGPARAATIPEPVGRPAGKDIELQTRLDRYLERVAPFGFSGGILVAKGGSILISKGYGFANREAPLPNTPRTVFYIGSLTKQFTAAAILKLEQQGKLSVSDSINKFFANVPDDKAAITIHHLLTNSSGLAHDVGDLYGAPVGRDEQVRRILGSKLAGKLGTYRYSNAGYVLAAAIVEIASGSSYEQYLHQQLFIPARMSQTGYRLPQWTLARVAHGYVKGEDQGSPLERKSWMVDGPSWAVRGAGGMLSTLDDLYRWHKALAGDSLLSGAQKQKLFTPHVAEGDNSHYGYGWVTSITPRKTKLVGHNGSDGIFYAEFLHYVDEEVVIIIVTNDITPEFGTIFDRVKRMTFEAWSPPLPPETRGCMKRPKVASFVGTYRVSPAAAFDISAEGDTLVLRPAGQGAINLLIGAKPELSSKLDEMNQRTSVILAEARDGKFDLLRAATGKNAEAFKRFFEGRLGADKADREQTILGSLPAWWRDDRQLVTIIKPGSKAPLLSVYWNGSNIIEMGAGDPEPYRAMLTPCSDTEFVGYHLGMESKMNVSFVRMAGSRANLLRVTTSQGKFSARRIDN